MPNNHKRNNGGRKLDDWLTSYLEFTSEQESPSLFHLWCGLSIIASAIERRVWINRGYYTLYPNLYVVLIGASARVRKSTAIGIGERLLREAFGERLPLVSQKITMEAFTSLMAKEFKEKGFSSSIIVADEFGVFLGKGPDAHKIMGLLTKLYDCPDIFDYHTLARGKEVGHKGCCNLLAGTTPAWLKESMPAQAVGGGFTSRIVFVYQLKPEHLEPWPELSPSTVRLRRELVGDLRVIGKIEGEMRVSGVAREWYSEWYMRVFKPETTPHASLDGYFGRKHDTLLKLACLFAVSKGKEVVDEIEMEMALNALNKNEKFLPQTLQLIQMSESGEETEKVLRAISRRGRIDHVTLMRTVSYALNAKRLEEVLSDLVASERVALEVRGGKRVYRVRR